MTFEEWSAKGWQFSVDNAGAMFGYMNHNPEAEYVLVYPAAEEDGAPITIAILEAGTYQTEDGRIFEHMNQAETWTYAQNFHGASSVISTGGHP